MLRVRLLRENAVVVLSPSGRLESSDFERVAQQIDPLIEELGELKGIMIRAERFPGWADFGALASHIKFVRDHHRKVRRIAVLSDSHALAILPALAQHFVSAEIRHFHLNEEVEAMAWLCR